MFTKAISLLTRKASKHEKYDIKNFSCQDKILIEKIISIHLGINYLPERKVLFKSSSF